jgi:dTDP-4-dehydrorhamnose 3,5-epimerase
MRIVESELPGVLFVEPDVFRDARGFFLETYNERAFAAAGLPVRFVQDNHSLSTREALRGLHAQLRRPQGKLVRVVRGTIYDVAVDLRPDSPAFGKWTAATLRSDDFRQIYVSPGFAHGFCVLSEAAEVEYKCTDFYDRSDEIGIRWNDPDLAIEWPLSNPILSAKDAALPTFAEMRAVLMSAARFA